MSLSKLWQIVKDSEGKPGVLQSTGSQRVGHDLATERQQCTYEKYYILHTHYSVQVSSVAQSCLTLCNPVDYQASLSFTISQSLLKLMCIESVMPSNHLILCRPFPFCLKSLLTSVSGLLAVQGTLKSLLSTTIKRHQFFFLLVGYFITIDSQSLHFLPLEWYHLYI